MTAPELLAPAGNLEKLKTALHFGADAVYLGGQAFSLRAFSENFDEEGLKTAIGFAHAGGKKVYVTANVFAKNADSPMLSDYFAFLSEAGADAAIVTDAGALAVAKKSVPGLVLHLSTQANTTNKYAAKFWQEQGVSRVVLARELSLAEIAEIRDFCPDLELEAFVHGAMCISYSGRCLLSNYLDGRDSNRGECVQACRWKYSVRALREEGEGGECAVEEDGRGSYIFNSKDLNMLPYLDRLAAAGVCSFKIEGRMKSACYLATVVNAYRRALDGTLSVPEAQEELNKVAHRAFTAAYALGENVQTVNYSDSQEAGTRTYVADVLENSVPCGDSGGRAVSGAAGGKEGAACALVQMRGRFRVGDILEILSPSDSFNRTFAVEEMTNEEGERVEDAKLVMQKLRLRCPYPLRAGDILRKV